MSPIVRHGQRRVGDIARFIVVVAYARHYDVASCASWVLRLQWKPRLAGHWSWIFEGFDLGLERWCVFVYYGMYLALQCVDTVGRLAGMKHLSPSSDFTVQRIESHS